MNPTLSSLLIGLGWAATGGLLVWLASYPLQRRSVSWTMASIVIIATVASIAALVGSVHEMLLSSSVAPMAISTSLIAGLVAAAAAAAATRRFTKDSRTLSQAIADLAAGRPPGTARLSFPQVERLRAELTETAARLAESRDRERALETARRDLVAWVSHDLRTPLAGLRAMSEALEDGVVAAPETYYKQIRVEVDRLSTMVEDLFELSRIQSGTLAGQVEQISLDDLISDCVAALEPLAAAQRVRLVGRAEGIATVTGNGPELNRALTNLVANAIRHTRVDGTVDVRVRADCEMAEVAVRDECGGIPHPELPRVFEVGFRGEAARTPHLANPAGAGLGLAITRGIIEAHDGTVRVENVAGGCSFVIQLPVVA
ncbi:sensor histidine kinase [Jatrophihabitans sp.]|uniref:sensor histidine kinase n=1 Tax=Jatrophihabitans sp. TaxID=1932789 RepID=UPI002B9149E1|nr:HAMP domain-containing sensor histidine kinase [Jatrophihabitans sp.]